MSHRLAGKRAFITGAGSGIGEAIARRFAQEGASIVVSDLDGDAAESVASSIRESGADAIGRALDVCDDDAVSRLAAEVAELGDLRIVVSNAGGTFGQYPRILDADIEYWDRMMNFNLRATFVVCRAFVPQMITNGGGSLITLASLGALTHRHGFGVYSTAKSAVARLTQAIATDHSEQGIRANVILPGMTETPAIAKLLARADDPDAARKHHAEGVPLGRLGLPEDIASAALYLASDDSSFVSGTLHIIDGGTLVAPN